MAERIDASQSPAKRKRWGLIASPGTMQRFSNLLSTGPAAFKSKAILEAQDQQKATAEKISKLGLAPSGYDFLELIGKGAFGRVYKRYVI